jgi:hypothetical protein
MVGIVMLLYACWAAAGCSAEKEAWEPGLPIGAQPIPDMPGTPSAPHAPQKSIDRIPRTGLKTKQALAPADSHLLGSAAMFLGWRGESSILRQEDNFETGRITVTYFALGPNSRMTRLRGSPPSDLPQGTVLVDNYSSVTREAAAVFQFDADPKEVQALEQALAAWWGRGDGKPQGFPTIHATLRILLRTSKERTVWVQKRVIGVSFGEAGYEFNPPRLQFAALSPDKSALVVELSGDTDAEFIRIPVPPT